MGINHTSGDGSPVVAALIQHAHETPDKLACMFLADGEHEQTQYTYKSLLQHVRERAAGLAEIAAPGERAILLFSPGISFLTTCLACLYAGIVVVPLYPPRNSRHWARLQLIFSDADATLILTSEDQLERFQDWSKSASNSELIPQTLAVETVAGRDANAFLPHASMESDTAVLQYTSGSTSSPKGVMVSHRNIGDNMNILCDVFGLNANSVTVSWLPHFHDMGLFEGQLSPIYAGATVYLMSPVAFVQRPQRWLAALTKYKATHTAAANFAFDLCVERIAPDDRRSIDLSHLETVLNGAEPIRHSTTERFLKTFGPHGFRETAMCPGYGLAETTLLVTDSGKDRPPKTAWVNPEKFGLGTFEPTPPGQGRPIVSSGKAAPGVEIAIVREPEGALAGPGEIGEIRISGDSVANGYWKRPDATREVFPADVPGHPDKVFLHTGDLGFLDEDGELFVCGRSKDVIISDGVNHYPQDIEQTAQDAHPSLAPDAGAAIGRTINGSERLTLIQEVRRTKRHDVNIAEIFAAVARAVSAEHSLRLDRLVLVRPGTIPKTSSGKIQRYQCLERLESDALQIVAEQSRETISDNQPPDFGELTHWLKDCVARTLGIENPNTLRTDRPLAEYGLTSVEAVSLSGTFAQRVNRDLPSSFVYDHPTLDEIADELSAETTPVSAPPKPSNPEARGEAIAIVGMACRFPGAPNVSTYWENLIQGVDSVREKRRLSTQDETAATLNTTELPEWGGYLDEIDIKEFDASFFGISPREAATMDPQQRLLLETAWETLANAGYPASRLPKTRTGIFVGISGNDYGKLQHDMPGGLDAYHATGNSLSIAANRLSYYFNFSGPSIAVDTACSSSLVAIHQACQSLRSGETDFALAGGVNLILSSRLTSALAQAGMMSPSGRCRTFDRDADGYVRGEGCGMIALKNLDQAKQDGDRIFSVIRGSAVNHGGRGNGLTAPTRQGQERVIRAALADAGVSAEEIQFVEAHGTGTPIGDPIEMSALANVFDEGRPGEKPLWVGSAKSSIGHLESAAGIAGLIKAVLSMTHKKLPGQLHFRTQNSEISADRAPRVIQDTLDLEQTDEPLLCGVSSFGFGGTNAHVILEAPAPTPTVPVPTSLPDGYELLPLTAAHPDALKIRAGDIADLLEADAPGSIADIAYTLAEKSELLEHRAAFVSNSASEMAHKLRIFSQTGEQATALGQAANGSGAGVVFVFSGQGTQWVGMGVSLAESEAVFSGCLDRANSVVAASENWSIFDVLKSQELQADTAKLQPTICAIQIGLDVLLRSRGIKPNAVIGHSLGEIAAAHSAGALTIEDSMKIAIERGKSMVPALGSGGMLATTLSAEALGHWIDKIGDGLELAVDNGEHASVASGPTSALETLQRALEAEGQIATRLAGDIPFHHSTMAAYQSGLRDALKHLQPVRQTLPVASTVTGQISTDMSFDADYWAENIRAPVRFREALAQLTARGSQYFIEIGPHPALQHHIQRSVGPDHANRVNASMTRDSSDPSQILTALAGLFVDGVMEPAIPGNAGTRRQVDLPAYPWLRQEHWIDGGGISQETSLAPDQIWQHSVTTGQKQAGFVPLDLDVREYPDKWQSLNRVAFADIERTLWSLSGGGSHLDQAKCVEAVAPAYKDLVKRWFTTLTKAGRIEQDQETWIGKVEFGPDQRQRDVEALKSTCAEIPFLADYVVRCGDRLTDIVTGRAEALETLFPNGSWDTVENLYHDWSVAKYFNSIVSAIVECRAKRARREKPIRVLEVGGGTGGMTRSIAPSLSGLNVEYSFTDISPYFFDPIRERLGDYPFISYGVLDLDLDPRDQGYADGSFDMIVAANSVHAVQNLPQTILFLRRLLADDGQLALYEITEQFPWLDSSVALIEGWSKFEDDSRSDSPLLNPDQWCRQLEYGGFEDACAFPSRDQATNILGQRIILARAAGGASESRSVPGISSSWLYQAVWKPEPLKNDPVTPARILVVADRDDDAIALAQAMEIEGGTAFASAAGDENTDWSEILDRQRPEYVIHVAGSNSALAAPAAPDIAGICRAQNLLLAALGLPVEQQPKILFATSGAVSGFDDIIDTGHTPLWGWARAAANEHPTIVKGIVDLDPASSAETRAVQLSAELTHDGDQSAWRAGHRYVSRLVSTDDAPAEHEIDIDPEGLYLISGGLGVLGLRVAEHLADQKAGGVILLSRSAHTEALSEAASQAVTRIEECGTRVYLAAADIADEARVRQIVETIEAESKKSILGVVHAAGALASTPLAKLDDTAIRHSLDAKARGAWVLHNIFNDRYLSFFVLFGSASSHLAPPGHGAYAAANAFLDGLAALRRQNNQPGTSISWGIWEGAGSAARDTVERFRELSFSQVPFETGLKLFSILGGYVGPDQIVLPGESKEWARTARLWMSHPVVEGLWQDGPAKVDRTNGHSDPGVGNEAALRNEVGAVMNLSPELLDTRRPLLEQGLDSLMAISLKGRIENQFGVVVPITALVGTTNIADLLELVDQTASAEPTTEETPNDLREVLSF